MSKNTPATIIATVSLSAAVAAMIALSSPVLARGGGRHHGECGEHRGAHECGHFEYDDHHHRGGGGRHFEHHRHFGYEPGDDYSGYGQGATDGQAPSPAAAAPQQDHP